MTLYSYYLGEFDNHIFFLVLGHHAESPGPFCIPRLWNTFSDFRFSRFCGHGDSCLLGVIDLGHLSFQLSGARDDEQRNMDTDETETMSIVTSFPAQEQHIRRLFTTQCFYPFSQFYYMQAPTKAATSVRS